MKLPRNWRLTDGFHENRPAVVGPFERQDKPVSVAHGSDEHLTFLGAPQHLNLLTGQDRDDMLAFGRACMDAERERCCRVVVVQRDDRLWEVARRTILAIRAGDDYVGDVDDEGLLRA